MLRFQPKRLFFILAPCVLIIGLMVPLATFAKSSTRQAAPATSSDSRTLLIAIKNDANCNVPPNNTNNPEVLFTFHAEDRVSGLAQMVSADTTENNQEVLVLKETKGPFKMRIIPNTATKHFAFTATRNGDQLTACYTLIGPDDEGDLTGGPNPLIDHPAAVTFTVSHED